MIPFWLQQYQQQEKKLQLRPEFHNATSSQISSIFHTHAFENGPLVANRRWIYSYTSLLRHFFKIAPFPASFWIYFSHCDTFLTKYGNDVKG